MELTISLNEAYELLGALNPYNNPHQSSYANSLYWRVSIMVKELEVSK
jgi:hypothetical protein